MMLLTVVLDKTLESPRKSNQSILKEISPEYSLEELMLKLKLQYFGHLMQRIAAAAAAAKSLVRLHRWQPIRLLRPWDSPGRNTGVGCLTGKDPDAWKD